MNIQAKKLKYKKLLFLSEEQLQAHHDTLYFGYVKKVNELRDKFELLDDFEGGNPSYHPTREMKLELGFVLNGVMLHELYFENMGGDGEPTAKIAGLMSRDFKSFEDWQKEFMALGMSARGWVVLAQNSEGRLENYLCDMHNQGGIWGANPVLVLDVYEHAYFIDYGTNRIEYLEKFIENIDWQTVEDRLK